MGALRRGLRNAFRNMTRTVSIVLIVAITFALALVMMVSHQAASSRVQSVSNALGTTVDISPAGFFGPGGGSGNPLSAADVSKVADTLHVTAVSSSVSDRLSNPNVQSGFSRLGSGGTTSLVSPITFGSLGRRFSGGGPGGGSGPSASTPAPVSVYGTTTPLAPSVLQATTITLVHGVGVAGSSSARDADVGSTLAAKNRLSVGSTFTAYGKTITVVGIFTSSSTGAEASLVLPLKTEQTLSGISGVTTITATVDTLGDVQSTATAIQRSLGTSVANVTTSQSFTSTAASELDSIKTITVFSLIGALIAAAAVLLMSMLMIVRERRREIGVLKAFGSSNGGVVTAFATEALTITAMAAVVGTVLGLLLANPVLHLLVTSQSTSRGGGGPGGGFGGFGGGPVPRFNATGFGFSSLGNLHAVLGTNVAVYAVLIAVAIALLGSIVPSYAIAKVRPAEVMRSE